jgi:hypothetical protein
MALDLRSSLLAAGLAAVLPAGASAQSCELPFDLVDVADDPLAPDWCGVDFTWEQAQPSTQVEAAGVSLADFDDDGLLDIFFPNTHPAPHRLYRNLGGFAFGDVAAAKGLADVDADAASATFFDYDHDGDLDLFLTSHLGSPTLPLGCPAPKVRRSACRGARTLRLPSHRGPEAGGDTAPGAAGTVSRTALPGALESPPPSRA